MKKSIYLLLLFCVVLTASAMATIHTITVANFQFTPTTVTAQVGDTIVWNWSNGDHTTTSTVIPAGATTWDQVINSSNTTFSYKLTQAGTYNYQCTPHAPNMAGTITVQGGATGVQEQHAVNTLLLYPNPANGTLHLDLSGMEGTVAVMITDASGSIVRVLNAAGGKPAALMTAGIPAGIYTVRATSSGMSRTAVVSIR